MLTDKPLHPPSPCVMVCQIDAITDLCVGCHRTQAEILGWRNYSAEQKIELLTQTAIRKEASNPTSCEPESDHPEVGNYAACSPASVSACGTGFSTGLGKVKQCGQCGDDLFCGPEEPGGDCWCDRLPNIMPLQAEIDSCLCANCLQQAIQARIEAKSGVNADDEVVCN